VLQDLAANLSSRAVMMTIMGREVQNSMIDESNGSTTKRQ